MSRFGQTRRRLRSIVAIVGLFAAFASPGSAGDEDIFTAQVPPNVLLMVDNSGSMNAIMEHESFDAASFVPTCDVLPAGGGGGRYIYDDNGDRTYAYCWPNQCVFRIKYGWYSDWVPTPDPDDHARSGYISRTFCGETRKLYSDGINFSYNNDTWYYPEYTEWLFSIDDDDTSTLYGPEGSQRTAPEILADIEVADNGMGYVDGSSFAKYQISRITAARSIATDVIYQTNSDCPAFLGDCGVYEDRVRFGIAQFQRGAHGGFVNARINDYSANKADLSNAINALDAATSTPLAETLFKLYTYFMSRNSSDRPVGKDGGTTFPEYEYNDYNGDYTSSSAPGDPVVEECQKNFIIIVTDGEPTSDNFNTSGSLTRGFSNFENRLIGDYYTDDSWSDPDVGPSGEEVGSPPWAFSSGSGYLDDIAKFMQDRDCRPDYPDTHNVVDVYTVGFSTAGAVNSLLRKTAENGNGLYFNGNQADELTEALVRSVKDIISKSQGFSAATVPAARTADGGKLYTTLFQPTSARPFWPGLLRSYQITVGGEIRDKDGGCALTNLTNPPACTGGTFKSEAAAPPFWNASKEMPGANGRKLLVSLPDLDGQRVAPFDHSLTAADLGGNLGSRSGYPPHPNVHRNHRLDEAIVAFIAGCEWGTGMSSGGGDDFANCVDRTRVESGGDVPDRLGDIFHSNPVVVGSPASFIGESSYRDFANDPTYAERDRVIIAGANDGFLHGFHAGDYDGALGRHDPGTGVEVFAFMPWGARSKVSKLARDDATLHALSVDGSPSVADVWIDHNGDPTDDKIASEWKTVLVTGMREGGEQYLALDVSDPSAASYPAYMWEFPLESDSAWRSRVGQTWSQPVITRVKTEAIGGHVQEKWVAIVGFGYDETSDPNAAATYNPSSLKGRGIAMIDVETGRPLAVRQFGAGVGEVSDMYYAIPSAPAVLDYDQDGFADIIYVGDLGGNVWKWVIRAPGLASPTAAQLYQPNWSFRKFFDSDPSRPTADHARSFYFAPSATLVSGILHLGMGSGERSHLNCSSALGGCDVGNRFYVLKDRDIWDTGSLETIDGRGSSTGDLTDVTGFEDSCPRNIERSGFFFEVEDGEKFVTNSEVFNAFFFASTFRPDLTNACEPSGISSLYGFLAKCGQGFFGPPSPLSPIAGSQRTMDLGRGIPTDARLSIAPGDGGNRLIISKQDGELINIDSGESSAEHGTLYWREAD